MSPGTISVDKQPTQLSFSYGRGRDVRKGGHLGLFSLASLPQLSSGLWEVPASPL